MSRLKLFLLAVLSTLGWAAAAADNTFDPANPPEPNDVYVPKHNVTVTASPEGMGYTTGTGRYKEGTSVKVTTSSAVANWVFKGWLKDGEPDPGHTSTSFSFTLGTSDVTYTALYEYKEPETPQNPDPDPDPQDPPVLPPFDPTSPADPEAPEEPEVPDTPDPDPDPPTPPVIIPKYSLTLVSSPFEACAFNISSGKQYTEGTEIVLKATGNQSFDFLGWYDQDGNPVSADVNFVYTMPASNSTLTARWLFNPEEPEEPMNPNDDTDVPFITGDVNRDGRVSILDVMCAISYTTGGSPAGFDVRAADLNGDGSVTIIDILALINLTSIY